MKIAYIGIRGVPAGYSGVERSVEEIGTRLAQKGHEITAYCMAGRYKNKEDSYKGMKLKYIPTIRRKNLEMICYAFLSSISGALSGYDICHFHAIGPSTLSFIPKLFGKKIIVTVHGLDWQRAKWDRFAKSYLRLGEWTSAKFADKTIVVSKALKKYYEDKYHKEVSYIPNGVDIRTSLLPRRITAYGLKGNDYLLFVGRLVPEKGCHYLIEAFKQIDTSKKLVIVGESAATDDYVEKLKKAANKNVIFTGYKSGDELQELYSNAYCYVQPSEIEGLPISVLEAMSYGKCALVSDIEENLETILAQASGKCGESFKTRDVDDLLSKIQFLLTNENLVKKYGEKARENVKLNYNWDAATNKTEQLMKKLL